MKTFNFSIKYLALLGLFILSSNNLIAQQNIILEFKNGKKIEGVVKKFNQNIKKIKIKDKNNKKIKVKSDELKSISLLYKKDTVVFNRYKYSEMAAFYKMSPL